MCPLDALRVSEVSWAVAVISRVVQRDSVSNLGSLGLFVLSQKRGLWWGQRTAPTHKQMLA